MKQTISIALLFLAVNVFAGEFKEQFCENYNIYRTTQTLREPIYYDKNIEDIQQENNLYALKRIAIDQRKYIEALENAREILWEIIKKYEMKGGD